MSGWKSLNDYEPSGLRRWPTSRFQPPRFQRTLDGYAPPTVGRERLERGRRQRMSAQRVADHLLVDRPWIRGFFVALLLFLLATMARHPALAARFASFFRGPLVRRAFLVCCLAAFTRDVALLVSVHRSKSAIFLRHRALPARE